MDAKKAIDIAETPFREAVLTYGIKSPEVDAVTNTISIVSHALHLIKRRELANEIVLADAKVSLIPLSKWEDKTPKEQETCKRFHRLETKGKLLLYNIAKSQGYEFIPYKYA